MPMMETKIKSIRLGKMSQKDGRTFEETEKEL
jgi:hypothetical protein